MRKLRATAIDRAGTNKAHRMFGCGKKREMSVEATVLHTLGGMSKYSLCKARSLHTLKFNEAPKRRSGVRWWKEHEQCEQVDRIGLGNLEDDYAAVSRQDYRALSGNTAMTVPSNEALDTALEKAKNDAAEKEKAYTDADASIED